MTGKTILLIEDEEAIREMVTMALERANFRVKLATDADEGERVIADGLPDLILLDWMLPGVSGIDLARRLRRDECTREIPIIMLTARSDEDDRIRGLESGADDYVPKPFSPRELVARIQAVLRRTLSVDAEGVIEQRGLRLDSNHHRASIDGRELEMRPTEFRLLAHFMSHPDRVYSRAQILDRVWSRSVVLDERTVDVHIRRLRKALEDDGYDRYIQTVRGIGYRFSTQD